jgi:hypothetical protein
MIQLVDGKMMVIGFAKPVVLPLRSIGHNKLHRQALDAIGDLGQDLKTRFIDPVNIINREQQRLLLCRVCHERAQQMNQTAAPRLALIDG